MLRLISLILLLAGAAVAALGGWLFMGNDLPAGLLSASEPALERKVLPAEPRQSDGSNEPPASAAAAPPPPPEPLISGAPAPDSGASAELEAFEPMVVEPVPALPENTDDSKGTKSKATARTRSMAPPAIVAGEPAPEAVVREESAPPAPVQAMPEVITTEDDMIFGTETTTVLESLERPPAPPPSLEEQLYQVPIAYKTPSNAAFNAPFTVELAINAQDGAETATGGITSTGPGTVREETVAVSDTVVAKLVGVDEAFIIEAESEKPQRLSKSTESVWRWKVTPTKTGPQVLNFEIWAVHPDNTEERLRTFNDTVTVEVSRIGQAMFLAQQYNPIVVIFAGIGSLLAGLFGVLRFFRGS